MTCRAMKKNGLINCDSEIMYLSRKRMGEVYSIMKELIDKKNGAWEREGMIECIYSQFLVKYKNNKAVWLLTQDIITDLKMLHVHDYRNIRFIDSWSSGTILIFLYCVTRFMLVSGDCKYSGDGVNIECYATMSKKAILPEMLIDAEALVQRRNEWWRKPASSIPSTTFSANEAYEVVSSLSASQFGIDRTHVNYWYRKRSLEIPSDMIGERLTEFLQLMIAQIYLPHYPYGTLNIGHPIDWDEDSRTLRIASPSKQIGALLRQLMLVNSIVDYVELEGSPNPNYSIC